MKRWIPSALLLAAVAAGAWYVLRPASIQYVVVRGDTLFEIARDHGVTVEQLREWNGLSGDLIEVDQVLVIYTGDQDPPASSGGTSSGGSAGRAPSASVSGSAAPDEGGWRSLTRPPPEPCVPFDPQLGDQDIVAPDGLSRDQLRAGLNGVVNETLRCDPGRPGEISMLFEITVGCDGVVSAARAVDAGGTSAEYAGCVAGVLEYADFPAHDMADGMTFQYPLRFEF